MPATVNRGETVLAAVPETAITKPVVPDDVPLTTKNAEVKTEFITKPVLAEMQPANKPVKPALGKKHKIHSLGDLFNVMIASVDKRKDKFIEFTDTDEGDNITGINLGIVKVKKEQ